MGKAVGLISAGPFALISYLAGLVLSFKWKAEIKVFRYFLTRKGPPSPNGQMMQKIARKRGSIKFMVTLGLTKASHIALK
jgi:hypothetical protein